MSGRTEMSTTLQDPNLELTPSTSATIALIGPNAAHRQVMAKALTGSEGRTVREFVDYPASLADIAPMMEENFDVVMIDVDSDQSYALQIVENIVAFNTAVVMVYSMRNDPELLRECMRAGARDFLPLPEDADEMPADAEAPGHIPAPSAETEALNPADFLLPEPADQQNVFEAQTSLATPEPQEYAVPSRNHFAEPRRPDPQPYLPSANGGSGSQTQLAPEELRISSAPAQAAESRPAESPSNDFSAWDSLWIRSGKGPTSEALDVSPKPSAPADHSPKIKSGSMGVPSGPQLVPRTASPVEDATTAAPLFRQVASSESALPHRTWIRWAIFAGVPLVIIGLLMLIFAPSSRPNAPSASQGPSAEPQAESITTGTAAEPARSPAKPSPAALSAGAQPSVAPEQSTPVASDMMDAQLNAPTRISGSMKKPAPVEEAPAGFAPAAIDTGDAIPGQIFGSQNHPTVVPGVSAISAGVAEGMLIHKTAPIYPEFAKAARVGGTVLLGANITKTGAIAGLHVISGPAMLRAPAVDAVKTWRYRPFLLNNQPVEVQTTIRVIFSLDQR
ncbi:MAG: TonB family protein [Terracidiphilus sp.]